MNKQYHSIRKQYSKGNLLEKQMDKNPLIQLDTWLNDAVKAECPEPTAMVLATVGHNLRPSSRVVLMKGLDDEGITFFTNYDSRKGQQILANPQASLLFFWPEIERQVRIEGMVTKVSEDESDLYFASRPESSRISAIISPQSREIPDRLWLATAVAAHTNVLINSRPANWGGYRLIPDYFEFWQGREDRLHDRIACHYIDPGWRFSRLAP